MSDTPEKIDHATFREQIATALAGGLSAGERSTFDAHAAECQSCSAELRETRGAEDRMTTLFASAQPSAGLEDRIIQKLRLTGARRNWVRPGWVHTGWVHPAVQKAVTGVAAAVVLAGMGYAVTNAMNGRDQYANAQQSTNVQAEGRVAGLKGESTVRGISYGDANRHPGEWPDISSLSSNEAGYRNSSHGIDGVVGGDRLVESESRYSTIASNHLLPQANAPSEVVAANGRPPDPNSPSSVRGRKSYAGKVEHGWTGEGAKPRATDELKLSIKKEDVATKDNLGRQLSDKESIPSGATAYFFSSGDAGKPISSNGAFKPTEWAMAADVTGGGGGGGAAPAGPAAGVAGDKKKVMVTKERSREVSETEIDGDAAISHGAARPVKEIAAATEGPSIAPQLALWDTGVAPVPEQSTPLPALKMDRDKDANAITLAQAQANEPQQRQQQVDNRKVIHNGQVEFEVDRFDAAFAQVSKLTTEAGGYVGTTDSEKLPNGKVKGQVSVRVPPDRLDTLILQLRGIGDLKSQKLDAQDVSKHYNDMESALRAARAMEERLIAIIKDGKGQIKDLLAAEKELGNWRTKVETLVGEMKYYDSLIAMSTLNVMLFERDIKTPATAFETETIDAGVETEDVGKSRAEALKAIEEAKGRVIQSDMKRYDAGQFGATIVAEVPQDAAGPLLDRVRQIGKVARLDVQRRQTSEAGNNNAVNAPVRIEKRNTRLNLSLYNLANVAPRQTTTLNLAADDVEAAYRAILARVNKAGGRIVTSNLVRNTPEQTTGVIALEVPTAEADTVAADLRTGAEVMKLAVTENPDVNNVTSAKRGYSVSLVSTASVPAREATSIQLAAADVASAREAILQATGAVAARILQSQLNESDRQNVNATLELEVRRAALPALEKVFGDAGDTISRVVTRSSDTGNTIDSKVKLQLTLLPADRMAPREATAMSVELNDVETALADLQSAASAAGGRVAESNLSKDHEGRSMGRIAIEVPLDKASEIVDRAKGLGRVRAIESNKNQQIPAGKLSRARIDVTFGNAEGIVAPDNGLFAAIRRGLSTSIAGLMWSLQLIIIGLCFVVPWVLILGLIWRFIKRRSKPTSAAG